MNMKFEYFSKETVEILRLAHKKATERKFEDVGTDHLLLAMTEELELFDKMGYDRRLINREISMLMGESDAQGEASNYTHRAKNVIENSILEIDHVRKTSVEPEHLLLSLVKESEGVAIRALENLHIDLNELQEKLEQNLSA